MNWLIVDPTEVRPDGRVWLTDHRAEYVRRTLGSRPAATFRVGLVGGGRGWARAEEAGPEHVVMYCEFSEAPLPRSGISLLLAMPRPKAMKRLWSQLVELGVERVWITSAEGVESSYLTSRALDPEVIRTRLREGMAQCGETRPPAIEIVFDLEQALRRAVEVAPEAQRWVVDPSFEEPLPGGMEGPVLLAIGPERGWSDRERSRMVAEGFRGGHLGPRILRAETACVAAIARCARPGVAPGGAVCRAESTMVDGP